jgi:hypothetical protein
MKSSKHVQNSRKEGATDNGCVNDRGLHKGDGVDAEGRLATSSVLPQASGVVWRRPIVAKQMG